MGEAIPRAIPVVELEHRPRNEDERRLLRAACKAIAKKQRKAGRSLQLEIERIYQASLEAAGRKVRPAASSQLIVPPRGILVRPPGLIRGVR